MGRVRIVTDSTADIPKELIEKYEIIVVPLKISFGEEVYREGVDITNDEVVARMDGGEDLNKTSQPSPGEFVAVYEKIVAKGDTVISIHISGKLSGTVQSARTAQTLTDNGEIHVIDSKNVSMGLGYVVLAAAKAAQEDRPVGEILELINKTIEKTFIYFVVGTLDYLEKGGRIGKATAFLGSLLKIAPILTLNNEGQIVPVEKVRGKNKASERIAQLVADRVNESGCKCAFMYGREYNIAAKLKEQVRLKLILKEPSFIGILGSVILCHSGPDIFGIVVCPD